ncbi:MAG: hypothetical protein QW596_02665 [Sulfolobales archaeon]
MNLTLVGISLILIGVILLMTAPLISIQVSEGRYVDVSGLTCIVIFFIPLCFSVGVPPMITAVFAIAILVVFGIIAYIAYRVYRTAIGHQ